VPSRSGGAARVFALLTFQAVHRGLAIFRTIVRSFLLHRAAFFKVILCRMRGRSSPVHRPIDHEGCDHPSWRSPTTRVMVFQWPWGTVRQHHRLGLVVGLLAALLHRERLERRGSSSTSSRTSLSLRSRTPRIYKSHRERGSPMKNRKREICTSGFPRPGRSHLRAGLLIAASSAIALNHGLGREPRAG
jgi:hypothetical protein